MEPTKHRIVRVLSNNAVLSDDGTRQRVVVGKGVGFGRKAGDAFTEGSSQQSFVEVEPERLELLNSVNAIKPDGLGAIARAIETATEGLGQLYPSVYVLLLDHISFAIQRVSSGDVIENPLAPQITALYPDELEAARRVTTELHRELGVELPEDEACFIALHLNAARLGQSVKHPLSRANALAAALNDVTTLIGGTPSAEVRAEISGTLVQLAGRIRTDRPRGNDAASAIAQALPNEHRMAELLMARLCGHDPLPAELTGETAYLTVRLHGWRQDITSTTTK